jgi:hypothetical protein
MDCHLLGADEKIEKNIQPLKKKKKNGSIRTVRRTSFFTLPCSCARIWMIFFWSSVWYMCTHDDDREGAIKSILLVACSEQRRKLHPCRKKRTTSLAGPSFIEIWFCFP